MKAEKYASIMVDETDVRQRIKSAEAKRDAYLQQIHGFQQKVFQANQEIEKLKKKRDEAVLSVSHHAIERFKERIVDMPTKHIRQILSSPELTAAYRKGGAGKYSITEAPDALVVIKNNIVVTVGSKSDSQEKLRLLNLYMEYWVDERIRQAIQEVKEPIMKFNTFRKWYYRNMKQTA